ncbi:hypothetical protein ACW7GZ_08860 [Luteimonas sp. A537]
MTMSFHCRMSAAASCALALFVVLHASAASAATERVQRVSATAVCEAPLPVFDTTLRKRPIGINNEGGASVFVSCSLPADSAAPPGGASVSARFAMIGGAVPVTVECQLVAGTPDALTYTAGSIVVPAAGSAWLTWNGVDKGAASGTLNFSCNLPPRVDLSTIMYREVDAAGGL